MPTRIHTIVYDTDRTNLVSLFLAMFELMGAYIQCLVWIEMLLDWRCCQKRTTRIETLVVQEQKRDLDRSKSLI